MNEKRANVGSEMRRILADAYRKYNKKYPHASDDDDRVLLRRIWESDPTDANRYLNRLYRQAAPLIEKAGYKEEFDNFMRVKRLKAYRDASDHFGFVTQRRPRRFDDEETLESALIGIFGTSPVGGEIYIDNDDVGTVPHFHIRNHQSGVSSDYGFITGIELQRAKYYHQQSPDDVLDDEQKAALSELMNTPISEKGKFKEAGITVWDYACLTWELNNPGRELPDDIEMPDYTQLG